MTVTFMEVKSQQRSNTVNALPIWYLVSRWGLVPKVCMHHFGCGMNCITGYYMIVKEKMKPFNFNLFNGNAFLNIVILYDMKLWGETFGSRTILLFTVSYSVSPFSQSFWWLGKDPHSATRWKSTLKTQIPGGKGTWMSRGGIRVVQKFT